MTTLTVIQCYDNLRYIGFSADSAAILTAIAGRESGYNDQAINQADEAAASKNTGTVGFWGPSFGLFQELTIKGETGLGTARDITYLRTGYIAQMRAAWQTSGGGTTFGAWNIYANGKNMGYLYKTDYAGVVAKINADRGASLDAGTIPIGGADTLGGSIGAVAAIPGDIVGGAASAAGNVFHAFGSVVDAINSAAKWITNPHNDWRILEVLLGGILITATLVNLAKGS